MAALGFGQFDLNTVDAVHTVDEENQYEDERNLSSCEQVEAKTGTRVGTTFMPYCSFAMSGFSEMKVKSLRFMVYGRGTISNPKMLISNTRSANT